MDFTIAVKHCLQNYANFSGRAQRSQYWFFTLFTVVAYIIVSVLDSIMGGSGILNTLATLGLLLPTIAVGVRRLHDLNKSGWWYLLILIPLIGSLVLFFWFLKKGTAGANNFGEDPLAGTATPSKPAV